MRSSNCDPLTEAAASAANAKRQRRDRVWLPTALSAAACLATLALCFVSWIPLGVPGEWTWVRLRTTASLDASVDLWAACVPALTTGLLLAVVFAVGLVCRPGRTGRGLLLLSLWLVGLAWSFTAQLATPLDYAHVKPLWVPYAPASSGYFITAVSEATNPGEFLRTYETRMRQGDVLHEGTHPPGLILLHRGLIALCRSSSQLTSALLTTIPSGIHSAFRTLEPSLSGRYGQLTPAERAALWLGVLVVHAMALGALVPLYGLVRLDWDARVAWCVATMWVLVPAISVFAPKSDILYPAIAAGAVWFWLIGFVQNRVVSTCSAICASGLMWVGLCLSLAFLPVLVLMLATGLFRTAGSLRQRDSGDPAGMRPWYRQMLVIQFGPVVVFCVTLAVLTLATALLWEVSLPQVWAWNYRNHAGFYAQFPRTYLKWLLVNPVEMACALGLPAAALIGLGCLWRRPTLSAAYRGTRTGVWLVLILLWLSGKNQGEAARLWILLMPFAMWLSANVFARQLTATRGTRLALTLLVLQMIASLITVAQVGGFHFDGVTTAWEQPVRTGIATPVAPIMEWPAKIQTRLPG